MKIQWKAKELWKPNKTIKKGQYCMCINNDQFKIQQGNNYPKWSQSDFPGSGWELGKIFKITEISEVDGADLKIIWGGIDNNGVYEPFLRVLTKEEKKNYENKL